MSDFTLWYIAGEHINRGDLVSIAANGTIITYRAGKTLPAFAVATRKIVPGESISFSTRQDTDLRSRTIAQVYG